MNLAPFWTLFIPLFQRLATADLAAEHSFDIDTIIRSRHLSAETFHLRVPKSACSKACLSEVLNPLPWPLTTNCVESIDGSGAVNARLMVEIRSEQEKVRDDALLKNRFSRLY